jgi:glycosyltransferase
VLKAVVEGTADLDAEVMLLPGGVDVESMVGPLPEHIKVVDFVPLSAILPMCDALVHHSGMNSMLSALAAGVPQVALPVSAGDSPVNAMVVGTRGAGIAVEREAATPEAIGKALREVLQESSYRTASEEVAAEMARMPAPHTVVERLAGLAAAR